MSKPTAAQLIDMLPEGEYLLEVASFNWRDNPERAERVVVFEFYVLRCRGASAIKNMPKLVTRVFTFRLATIVSELRAMIEALGIRARDLDSTPLESLMGRRARAVVTKRFRADDPFTGAPRDPVPAWSWSSADEFEAVPEIVAEMSIKRMNFGKFWPERVTVEAFGSPSEPVEEEKPARTSLSKFWRAGDGRTLSLREMTDDHVWNTIRFLERNGASRGAPGYATLDDLREEWARRQGEKQASFEQRPKSPVVVERFAELELDLVVDAAPAKVDPRFAELELDTPAAPPADDGTSVFERVAEASAFSTSAKASFTDIPPSIWINEADEAERRIRDLERRDLERCERRRRAYTYELPSTNAGPVDYTPPNFGSDPEDPKED